MPHDLTIDKRRLLEQHPLFGQLEAEELDRLVTYMRVARYPRRTVLFRKGDPGTNMMVVLRGRVKVCTHSEDGKELVLNLFSPGDVFGEIALLDGADRTADAVTLDDCDLLVLERRDFLPFLHDPSGCLPEADGGALPEAAPDQRAARGGAVPGGPLAARQAPGRTSPRRSAAGSRTACGSTSSSRSSSSATWSACRARA